MVPMVVASICCTRIVRYVMGYPTVHGPDAQAHQNVVAFVVVGRYQPHQLERSYIPLVQVPIIESRDIKKRICDCTPNSLFYNGDLWNHRQRSISAVNDGRSMQNISLSDQIQPLSLPQPQSSPLILYLRVVRSDEFSIAWTIRSSRWFNDS